MTEQEQIERLSQNRHLIAGGVYTAATVDEVAGWIQTTCELAMRVIMRTSGRFDVAQISDLLPISAIEIKPDKQVVLPPGWNAVTAAPLPPDMPRVTFIEDDGGIE